MIGGGTWKEERRDSEKCDEWKSTWSCDLLRVGSNNLKPFFFEVRNSNPPQQITCCVPLSLSTPLPSLITERTLREPRRWRTAANTTHHGSMTHNLHLGRLRKRAHHLLTTSTRQASTTLVAAAAGSRGSSRAPGMVFFFLFPYFDTDIYIHLDTTRVRLPNGGYHTHTHSDTPHNVPLQVDAQPQHDDNPSRRHDKLSMWHIVNTIMMTVNTTRFGCMTWLVNDGTLPVHRGAAAWENQCMFFFLHIILIY
jgi:hypothetical protein